jgi:phosphoadenosine phosphosulfate reductase
MQKLIDRRGQVLEVDPGLTWLTLAQWQEQGATLSGQRLGLEFQPNENPETVARDLNQFAALAARFPKFTDGRGLTIAQRLRVRFGWNGPLWAVGDVLQDQVFAMARVGFDYFALRDDQNLEATVAALTDDPVRYQASWDETQPLWRRVERPVPMFEAMPEAIPDLAEFEASAIGWLRQAVAYGPAALASSMGKEDQAMTALIAREKLPISIFTLDTGRLPPQTLDLIAQTEARYRLRIRVLFPAAAAVEQWVAINGINGFRESVSQRKHCCEIRKLEPLRRALQGQSVWIAGLRRAHGEMRGDIEPIAHDAFIGIPKCAPLHDWPDATLDAFLAKYEVPVNTLHEQGYPSVGCAPCTRPIAAGEAVRAGRWWWEQDAARECGLHAIGARE